MDDVMARAGIFQGVSGQAASAIRSQLIRVDFERGVTVFGEGDAGDRLYIIAAGKVKVGRRTDDGRESLLTLMGAGDVFGELALFDPGPRTSTVTTLTEVRTYTMDRPALHIWIKEHPEVAEQLLRVLARRLRRTNDAVTDIIFTDVPGRVAKQLLGLAERFGVGEPGAVWVHHELTQVELAQLVGSSRETVNKALREFSERGWIQIRGKSVRIKDPERLARRAR